MVNDQPDSIQLEEMVKFCKDYDKVYIYDCGRSQELIAKYCCMAQIKINGFLVEGDRASKVINGLPCFDLNKKESGKEWEGKSAGVIIAIEDIHYNYAVKKCQMAGLNIFYFMSEHNKRTIPYKMTPRPKDRFWLEVNLSDYCNLNCQMCDHFAPIADKTYYDLQEFERDMTRIADLTDHHIGSIKLQGGEPLLNDNLIEYIYISRRLFPNTQLLMFTDGILLLKWENHKSGNLWKVCKECNLEIQLTKYPINLDYEAIDRKAEEYGVAIDVFTNVGDRKFTGVKTSVKHPFDLQGQQEPFRFIDCYQFNEVIVMSHGKIYTCPMIPYVKYFNKYFKQNLIVSKDDFIDIYQAKTYEEIAEFCTHRAEFCKYCATNKRTIHKWKQSKHDISEWTL